VPLSSGRFALVDDAYIRDCILRPRTDPPAGYPPIMPSFEDVVDEGEILALNAYISSLSPETGALR
jgi:cytochrome c oxidase subunit II